MEVGWLEKEGRLDTHVIDQLLPEGGTRAGSFPSLTPVGTAGSLARGLPPGKTLVLLFTGHAREAAPSRPG